eukprot:TRINITY_DN33986_c0_g2_i1.p1 TRINITY_DN33986_c0_g2~~TRINITY_DN33986_c0_g2_i1.p1  ORF type:complete len:454 (-),score=106.63 TRINITY_DN33986_c0_g2_i1:288-1649(-)
MPEDTIVRQGSIVETRIRQLRQRSKGQVDLDADLDDVDSAAKAARLRAFSYQTQSTAAEADAAEGEATSMSPSHSKVSVGNREKACSLHVDGSWAAASAYFQAAERRRQEEALLRGLEEGKVLGLMSASERQAALDAQLRARGSEIRRVHAAKRAVTAVAEMEMDELRKEVERLNDLVEELTGTLEAVQKEKALLEQRAAEEAAVSMAEETLVLQQNEAKCQAEKAAAREVSPEKAPEAEHREHPRSAEGMPAETATSDDDSCFVDCDDDKAPPNSPPLGTLSRDGGSISTEGDLHGGSGLAACPMPDVPEAADGRQQHSRTCRSPEPSSSQDRDSSTQRLRKMSSASSSFRAVDTPPPASRAMLLEASPIPRQKAETLAPRKEEDDWFSSWFSWIGGCCTRPTEDAALVPAEPRRPPGEASRRLPTTPRSARGTPRQYAAHRSTPRAQRLSR